MSVCFVWKLVCQLKLSSCLLDGFSDLMKHLFVCLSVCHVGVVVSSVCPSVYLSDCHVCLLFDNLSVRMSDSMLLHTLSDQQFVEFLHDIMSKLKFIHKSHTSQKFLTLTWKRFQIFQILLNSSFLPLKLQTRMYIDKCAVWQTSYCEFFKTFSLSPIALTVLVWKKTTFYDHR